MATDRVWTGTVSSDYTATGNWKGGVVPVVTDRVWIGPDMVAAIDLTHSGTGVTLTEFHQSNLGTYAVGTNVGPLKINATNVYLGELSNSGSQGASSQRINLDMEAVATSIYVYGSASGSTDTGKEPIRIKGTSISLLYVSSGRVGIATDQLGDVPR